MKWIEKEIILIEEDMLKKCREKCLNFIKQKSPSQRYVDIVKEIKDAHQQLRVIDKNVRDLVAEGLKLERNMAELEEIHLKMVELTSEELEQINSRLEELEDEKLSLNVNVN